MENNIINEQQSKVLISNNLREGAAREELINSEAILSVISKLSLFTGLNEEEFAITAGALKTLKLKKGESIFLEGDEGEDMFIHYSGELSAFVSQSDGTQRLLFKVEVGDFFGEMSIITHEPRSVTITATEDSMTIKLKGNDFYRIINEYPLIGFKILNAICVVQNKWLNKTSKSFSDLIRWGETARRRAITDEMTGLYNRRFLEESVKERFTNKSVSVRIMSLLMMDLDKIHGINDRHGTKAGDIVITAAAEEIRSCLRAGDIPARLSGDEFAVLLPDTDKNEALKIAERVRKKIEERLVEVPETPGAEK
ncbi:MAG: GGDEF domain-containing protein, partial [Treponema sp.]|nr:GGDEF domain-containing protein [Treponema sp.]